MWRIDNYMISFSQHQSKAKVPIYVMYNELLRNNKPLPPFYREAHKLVTKVWEEPLPAGQPYAGRLHVISPDG